MIRLLIVHRDAEIGRQLVQMVRDYTGYESALTGSESETLVWLRRRPDVHPRMLLTQLHAPGLDGLILGAMLSEMFAGLQTLFFPPYSAAEQPIEVAGSKIFPEPIDGERLIATVERSVRMVGNPADLFQAIEVLQMCCLAGRSGAVQMVSGANVGTIYLRNGQLAHAETSNSYGYDAIVEIVSWGEIEFAYEGNVNAPATTLKKRWEELLIDAVEEYKRRALPEWRQQLA
ncbi:MAG: two-component system, chemotaxis family, protein-glutamate methylesterase/glutaminase [Verrucomicrobiota bacterium]